MIEKRTLAGLLEQNLSYQQIASKLGCNRSTVQYWTQKYGLRSAFGSHTGDLRKSPEQLAADMSRAAIARRRQMKARAIEYKGGRCISCGYNRCNAALEFHHVDKRMKMFGLSRKGIIRSWDSIEKELDKCVLICANCHREVEAGLKQIPMVASAGRFPTGA